MLGLRGRGFDAIPVADIGLGGKRPDADLVRQIGTNIDQAWVFVTLDLSIIEEASGFEWHRYAIAWVMVRAGLANVAFEHAKQNIVHKHAEKITSQEAGDHWSYTDRSCFKHPPGLVTDR